MDTTELLASVLTPEGKMASVRQLNHAVDLGKVDEPRSKWTEKHRRQLQKYVDSVKRGRLSHGK